MKTGDVVQLKSGGPLMTVQETREDLREGYLTIWVTCVWFASNSDVLVRSFVKDTLKTPDERTF